LLYWMEICKSVFGSFFVHAALGDFELTTPEQVLGLLVTMSRKKVVDKSRRAKAARRDYRRVKEGAADREKHWAAVGPSPSQEVAGAELLQEFRRRLSEEEQRLADRRAPGGCRGPIPPPAGGRPQAPAQQTAPPTR